jgi:D-alanyl-D-alanine carboxypeptidase
LAAVLVVALPMSTWPASSRADSVSPGQSVFHGTIERIDAARARRMTGVSWHRGCPVALRDLRLLTFTHWGFDGEPHAGRLIVHRDVARDVVGAFRTLYADRFPIRRMIPVDAYGASDFRSIEADNTSAFNCRYVEGTTRWSEHAYGRAIDVNPIENPYVSGGRTSHRASRPYLDRARHRPGMGYEGGALVRAFDAIGWGWGGRWTSAQDFQHFSASGR